MLIAHVNFPYPRGETPVNSPDMSYCLTVISLHDIVYTVSLLYYFNVILYVTAVSLSYSRSETTLY